MKKKILLSIVAMVLICFSIFGFAGCDSRTNAPTLTVQISDVHKLGEDGYVFERKTLSDIGDRNSDGVTDSTDVMDYKDTLVLTITYTNPNDSKQNKKWTSYRQFVNDGGQVTGFDLDRSAGEYVMEFMYLTTKAKAIEYKLK